jgi:hypothetical protein
MKARPILSAPMVRALLDGRKVQTRRVIKPPPVKRGAFWELHGASRSRDFDDVPVAARHSLETRNPYGKRSDLLWVRESCWARKGSRDIFAYCAADETLYSNKAAVTEIPSIHMPRCKSRLTLALTDIRAQRLQDITADDIRAEGVSVSPVTPSARFGQQSTAQIMERPSLDLGAHLHHPSLQCR